MASNKFLNASVNNSTHKHVLACNQAHTHSNTPLKTHIFPDKCAPLQIHTVTVTHGG